ncbi:MAG: hypothetical protein HYW49_02945 [Deltaproteobacteria bacterium]|nr:hypothetical protein [Deltaproteobacteria bacterium]
MDRGEEAQEILRRIKADDFVLLHHASQRAEERGISKENVIYCAKTCFHWEWQEEKGTHFFLGSLNEKDHGGFTAVLRDRALVITVFKRRLTKWEKTLKKSKKP